MANRDINSLITEILKLQRTMPRAGPVLSSPRPGIAPFDYNTTENDPRGDSPVNRILDIISRPLYAVSNQAKSYVEYLTDEDRPDNLGELVQKVAAKPPIFFENPKEYLSNWAAGLSGKEKTTGRDILDAAGAEPGFGTAATSFALDVGLDPLTYIGLGVVKNLGKGTINSVRALRGIENTGEVTSQQLSREISRKAAGLAEKERIQADELARPRQTPSVERVEPIEGTGVSQVPSEMILAQRRSESVLPGQSARNIVKTGPFGRPIKLENLRKSQLTTPQIASIVNSVKGITATGRKTTPISIEDATDVPLTDFEKAIIQEGIEQGKSAKKIRQDLQNPFSRPVTTREMTQEIPTQPREMPTTTIAGTGDTIATPISRSINVSDLLQQVSGVGLNWQRMIQRALRDIPEDADLLTTINRLEQFRDSQTSPVFRNMVNAQIRELRKRTVETRLGSNVIQLSEEMKAQLAKTPIGQQITAGKRLAEELENLSKQAGASAQEARQAKKFTEDLFNPTKDSLYEDTVKEARQFLRQAMTGERDPNTIHSFNKKVYEALGDGNPKVLGQMTNQTRVVEAIMTRFATWWNAKDLRPFAREYIDTARNIAAAFAKSMTPLIRRTTQTQRSQAWRVTQGRSAAANPQEQALANEFSYLVENLMGTHGISDNSSAVALRSGTTMTDINKELPVALRFTNKKGIDDFGREFDYSKGNWMHSWKEWDIKEPAEAIYQLTRALQLATRKNAMLDDAAARWGQPTRVGEFNTPVKAERLQGFYFPKQIADQLDAVWERIEKDRFKAGPPLLQFVDKVQRMWKTGVTIYSPSHHIRNLNGDLFLSLLDGVKTVTPYRKSAQVLHAYRGRYKDIENIMNIMDPNLRNSFLNSSPGKTIVTTGAGHKLTAEQVYLAAENQGFLLRAAQLEDLVGDSAYGTFGPKFQPFGGRLHSAASGTSELRDHWVRLAHFIDVLSKSKHKNLKDAITEAGQRVKKFHPDGSDLTGFEQNVMRRVLPFYSWLRKSTPLVIEGLVMRPHISLAYPKAMAALQSLTGIESEGPGDPFPMDQMFPDWIKEKGIGPVISPESSLAGIGRQQTWRGETPGYVVVNPTNPIIDQLIELGNPKKTLASGLTPFVRIPGELLTGHTALGIPLENVEGGTAGHLLQQVPPVGIGARVTGLTRPDEPYHPEQLINWLISGGLITGTGPYEMQANYEITDKLQQEINRNRKAER